MIKLSSIEMKNGSGLGVATPNQDSPRRSVGLMTEVAENGNKAFGAGPKDFVQPSEEPLFFTLTANQLREIISQAVTQATEPILQDIQDLKATITTQAEKITALEATTDVHAENDLNQLRLIADLRKSLEPQPMQRDRAEILRALLAANNGKMLSKEARQKMHLSKSRFSELLATMKNEIEIKPYYLKRNQKVLVLK